MLAALLRYIRKDETGAYSVEFALIAPIFLTFLFGIFEVGVVLLRCMNVESAAQAGNDYIVNSIINDKTPTEAALRSAIRSQITFNTANGNLHVSLKRVNSDNLSDASLTFPIADQFEVSTTAKQAYILAVGYDMDPFLPWTATLIPYRGPKPQIQSVVLVNTAVKVTG